MHTRRSASKFYPIIMCMTTSMAFREYEFLSKQRQPPRESYHKIELDQAFYGGSRTIRLYISVRWGNLGDMFEVVLQFVWRLAPKTQKCFMTTRQRENLVFVG